MSYLEIYDRAGQRWMPAGDYFTLGRSTQNHVVLHGATVSRNHARIRFQGNRPVLEDLGSTYGTVVNGQRIQEWYALRDGDQIQLGDAMVVFHEGHVGGNEHDVSTPPHGSVAQPGAAPPRQVFEPRPLSPVQGRPSRPEAQGQVFDYARRPAAPAGQPPPAPSWPPAGVAREPEHRRLPDSIVPPNMIRCPNCGTLNLKSNTLCYRCGNTLWRPTQPAVPARAGAAAPAARPARSEPPRRAGVPGWLLTILVALSIVLLSLLSMLTGLLLANGSLASLFA